MCGAATWVYSGETTRSPAALLPANGAELAVVYSPATVSSSAAKTF